MMVLLVFLGFTALALDTSWQDPSQNTGDFYYPQNAYHNDYYKATARNNKTHVYWGYGFNFAAGTQIIGIEVRLDAKPGDEPEDAELAVELSWDGGTSWTSTGYSVDIPEEGSRQTYILGGSSNTWGHTWTASELNDTNFRIRITASMDEDEVYLYWVPVRVYYTEPAPELTLSTSSVDFGNLTQADFDNGYKELSPAQTLYITSSVGWVVTVKAASSTWTYTGGEPDPLKPCTDLEWKSTSSDPAVTATNTTYMGMTTTNVQVAAGNPGANIDVQMHFKLLLSYEDDPGGNYSLPFVYTLTSS